MGGLSKNVVPFLDIVHVNRTMIRAKKTTTDLTTYNTDWGS